MVGFIIGAACLFGLAKVARHHHRHHGGCGHWRGRGRRSRRGGFRAWGIERALDYLEVSREQEDVIRREMRVLRERRSSLRNEAERTRNDAIDALRSDTLDEEAIANMYVRHDELMAELRNDVVGAFGRVHAVLDTHQREQLASVLERGRGRRFDGPYRTL